MDRPPWTDTCDISNCAKPMFCVKETDEIEEIKEFHTIKLRKLKNFIKLMKLVQLRILKKKGNQ